jgi:hypothetical protein
MLFKDKNRFSSKSAHVHSTKFSSLQHHLQQLRLQFAQAEPDTLGDAFNPHELAQILTEEIGCHRQRIYPPLVTLRLFIDQVLAPDQACQEAVSQRLISRMAYGQTHCSLNTGPYCKARQRLSLRLPQRLCKHLGVQLERCAAPLWGWRGRAVKLFDATTVSMPDTPLNQQTWPQSGRQQPGLGFPIARIGALISLSSGAVIDYAVGPMKGKCSGEQALLRVVSPSLSRCDILLADALHSTWWAVQMLRQRGVDVVMPNDGKRQVDFTQGRVHSQADHVAWWPKPARAPWITGADYEQMPAGLWVREVKVKGVIIVTTLLEPVQISPEELGRLYAMRWNIEVDFRTLKTVMNMDVLRCKSPNMVEKEIAVYFLTYNLVRWAMVRAARLAQVCVRELSFTGARRLIRVFACHLSEGIKEARNHLASALLKGIARCVLPKRPGRIEPRAKKRRPKPLPLLTVPRSVARAQIRAQRA